MFLLGHRLSHQMRFVTVPMILVILWQKTAFLVLPMKLDEFLEKQHHFQQVYVFTNDVGNLHIPRSVWIIDAYGFLGFHCESPWPRENDDSHDEDVVAFSTRLVNTRSCQLGSLTSHYLLFLPSIISTY